MVISVLMDIYFKLAIIATMLIGNAKTNMYVNVHSIQPLTNETLLTLVNGSLALFDNAYK